jgi:glycosyltransferase involved in cell wall biosynthesis
MDIKLSIITINYNNAEGLRKTLASVAAQTYPNIEHIIVDGNSTDGSVDVIREYESTLASSLSPFASRLKWLSEPDKGIYNAMNKGIKMATGDYCQFLNSGDILINANCTQQMVEALEKANNSLPNNLITSSPHHLNTRLAVIYGNMKKAMPDGTILHDSCNGGNEVTLNMFYRGCLNHSPAYIRKDLFEKYGLYDETLRICSDWKFYLQSIVLGGESVQYANIDMTLFDMTGISETSKDLLNEERNRLLQELIPAGILKDYDEFHFPMIQYRRLKKYHLWGLVHFVERVCFKLEKWSNKLKSHK